MKKDAKANLTNMIGSIGGTLGVFIEFSFVGFFLYLHGQAANLLTSRNGNKIVRNNSLSDFS